MQIGTLLNAIEEDGFTAAFGGGRRDEEKARAKERVYSHRDEFGQWDPKMQRPELWSLYNGRIHGGEHMRIFPLSNWTELDIWHYIDREEIEIPSIYFSHQRRVFERDGMLLSESPSINPLRHGETVEEQTVRFRTVGDLTLTGCVECDGRHHRRDHRRDRHRPGHRARRHPWRRPVLRGGHGRPQEGRLLLMATTGQMDLLRFATAGSVDDGKSTLIGRLLLDSKSIFEDQLEAVEATSRVQGLRLHRPRAADRRPALRARAGHHHRRGLPLLRDARAASSSSPTPRATCSTPATWSPAPRPPTSAWCSSTPARASPSSPAGTR